MGPQEKRRYIRTAVSVSLLLRYEENNDVREIEATTKNISATGMLVKIDRKLPTDQKLDISFFTPNHPNPVHCKGKAVWSTALAKPGMYHCGIEFTHIEEDNKNTFLKFLCDSIYKTVAAE